MNEYVVLSVDAANELYRRIKNGTRDEALDYFTKAAERRSVNSERPHVCPTSQPSVFGAALAAGIIGEAVAGG